MTISFFSDKSREDELFYALAQELKPGVVPVAEPSLAPEARVEDALASVIVTLTKFAEQLESVGHPNAAKVDDVLSFIEREFITPTKS